MVADDLAISLADRYVRSGDYVLDPFCGSGRLLAAAAQKEVFCVGSDLNPLAYLLTRAKLAWADPTTLADIARSVRSARRRPPAAALELRGCWKVDWFSPSVAVELGQIVAWINELSLGEPEKLLIAAALSAAARDASFARKGNWKLHRIGAEERGALAISAWDCFTRRLTYCVSEAMTDPLASIGGEIGIANALELSDPSSIASRFGPFDVVLTSPPYGDSRTTVQYGAASALTLEVISRIEGLGNLLVLGRDIDSRCLGGGQSSNGTSIIRVHRYWAGSKNSAEAQPVSKFLGDFGRACSEIAFNLKPGGVAVLILGCRSTGGYRLELDQFAVDCFQDLGFRLASVERRRLHGKHLPRKINRFARSSSPEQRAKGSTQTISHETILVFTKPLSETGSSSGSL